MGHRVLGLKYYINALCTEESLFFTGFIVYLGRGMWETTMLPLSPWISQMCLLLSIIFIVIKIVFFDAYSVSGYIGLAIGFSGAIMIYFNSGYTTPFFWFLLLVGCKNVSFEKIQKVYLVIVGSIMILSLCAALLGVIENLIYKSSDRGTRISFGSVYVTDFASHIFYIILTYCYLKADRLKLYHFVGIIIITGIVYYFCKTRLDCVSILLIVVFFGTNRYFQKKTHDGKRLFIKRNSIWKSFGLISMPLMSLVSFIITIFYKEDNKVLAFIDRIISSRLSLGKSGLDNFGIKLWGQSVDMVGAGGTIQWPDDYFFVDCSYIYILLRFGLIFTITLLVVYVLCCCKRINDIYFLIVITLVSINCVIAHHILDIAYNPFACAFIASFFKKKNYDIDSNIIMLKNFNI